MVPILAEIQSDDVYLTFEYVQHSHVRSVLSSFPPFQKSMSLILTYTVLNIILQVLLMSVMEDTRKITVGGTHLGPIYSCAGNSTISYVESYQVPNTLLRINYLTCLVPAMAPSGFGPYHGLWLEDTTTKCIGAIPTPWVMTFALGFVRFPPHHRVWTAQHQTFGGYIDRDGGVRARIKMPKLAQNIFKNQEGLVAAMEGSAVGGGCHRPW